MPHGDLSDIRGGRCSHCTCHHCALTKSFLEFRDSANPPARPSTISCRREAAAFLRGLSVELVTLVDAAEEAE
jgi:hypothetical protein